MEAEEDVPYRVPKMSVGKTVPLSVAGLETPNMFVGAPAANVKLRIVVRYDHPPDAGLGKKKNKTFEEGYLISFDGRPFAAAGPSHSCHMPIHDILGMTPTPVTRHGMVIG